MSWRHYVYGSSYLGRADVREDLRHAANTRIAHHGKDKDYRRWRRTMRRWS